MKIFEIKYLLGLVVLVALNACQSAEGNKTGSEFVPGMAHSIAIEANVYHDYSLNNFDETSVMKKSKAHHRGLPVKGTMPRGYAGGLEGGVSADITTAGAGTVPYYYADTEEDRNRAMAEITTNPYPITDKGLAQGKELFNIYCAVCHGEKADGLGWLVDDKNTNSKYPAAPANLLLDEFINASEGRFYHAIMYGKNVMGPHADKLSYKERWDVIHYIRSLQAKEKKLVYNAEDNTLNGSATPAAKVVVQEVIEHASDAMQLHEEEAAHGDEHTDEHHGDAHGH